MAPSTKFTAQVLYRSIFYTFIPPSRPGPQRLYSLERNEFSNGTQGTDKWLCPRQSVFTLRKSYSLLYASNFFTIHIVKIYLLVVLIPFTIHKSSSSLSSVVIIIIHNLIQHYPCFSFLTKYIHHCYYH